MVLHIVLISVAFFAVAFLGLNKFWPIVFGLAAIIGMMYSFCFLWLGISENSAKIFLGGCVLLLFTSGLLIYLKSACSD